MGTRTADAESRFACPITSAASAASGAAESSMTRSMSEGLIRPVTVV
jgi:hypothetical protein